MKIYINGRFLTQSLTGVQRYASEVVKQIDLMLEKNLIDNNIYKFILVTPNDKLNNLNLKHIKIKSVGKLKGHLWEQFELPFFCKDGILLSLCNVGPVLKRNQLVTIHDAAVYAVPDTFSFSFRIWYQILLRLLGKVSKKIITVSNFSKKELIKYAKINEKKIKVIYEGAEHILNNNHDYSILEKHHLKKRGYVLAVSSLNPRKNFKTLIKAFKEPILNNLNLDFVIAGPKPEKLFAKIKNFENKDFKYLGYVTDSELRTLYENALCFVYPSLYEGFGIPPLEAMLCGCPVIVSNQTSLPEICGNKALQCNPMDSNDIAKKILLIYSNDELRKKLIIDGKTHARNFSWSSCTKELIKELINL
ncbi:glycosyltransferase family 1 protein [Geobacillus stearothermophilus]|uniref:glycosyltransferase family 4 protein n=1 Tax=Geobacillus stearothermophilus TaxID=1422 RepID=UPI002E1CBD56|nr:glycosyltransferase family 1 protein [Geobacillus stearothermophilus]